MWGASRNEWIELARRSDLTVLMDLDEVLVSRGTDLDRSLALLLDAVACTGPRLVVITDRGPNQLEESCRRAYGLSWYAESGRWQCTSGRWEELAREPPHRRSVVGRIREHAPGTHLLAIGARSVRAGLETDERAISATSRESDACAFVPGPIGVRGLLWWFVEARSGRSNRLPPLEELGRDKPQ